MMCNSFYNGILPAISVFFALMTVNGCAERAIYDQQAGIAGVGSMIDHESFEEIDLISILDPEGKVDYSNMGEVQKINAAFDAFVAKYSQSTLVARRNAVQERILAASNQRCGYFKSYLYASRAGVNFGLGSAATATAAAGAIVTGLASNILAGTAAVFTGVRAEYNQEFFANLAAHVVLEGVDVRRRQVYEQIVLYGQSKAYSDYNVQGAIKDAIYYHGECTAIVGIQMAADTIKFLDDPGIDSANRVLAKLKTTNLLLNKQDLDPQEAIKLVNTTEKLLEAGTPLGDEERNRHDPLDELKISLHSISNLSQEFAKDVDSDDLSVNLTDPQKIELKSTVKAAKEHASKLTSACKDKSVTASTLLSEKEIALKQADLPSSTAADLVQAKFELEEVRLQAEHLIEIIGHPVALLESHLKSARALFGNTPPQVSDGVSEIKKMQGQAGRC